MFEEPAAAPPDDPEEKAACTPVPVKPEKFNPKAKIPCGLSIHQIRAAMDEFAGFLGFINTQLHARGLRRFESMLMPANFSSMVGEFMTMTIPKHCLSLAKNTYHNGHPDMLPKGKYPNDSLQHGTEGIEVKASRYRRGWQGHNPEECWLMVFVFESNRPVDVSKKISPRPFRFKSVFLGQLTKNDWLFSGRSETSRRTITASVTRSGFEKMTANWIYQDDESE
ncbi:MAG: hypothetical protein HYS13_24680 [Planctomycetia bacterium]|nr:hypothetical protein [Planctomycetia bacterium]